MPVFGVFSLIVRSVYRSTPAIRGEMFSRGHGFVVDYVAEILGSLRNHDFSDRYNARFRLSDDISTRDRDGINKTFSGLMKILFPHGEASDAEIEDMLRVAIEGRKRVKDQLLRIDQTYPAVRFAYFNSQGAERLVTTLEEEEYPNAYYRRVDMGQAEVTLAQNIPTAESAPVAEEQLSASKVLPSAPDVVLKEQHIVFQENQRGVSSDKLFGPYLAGAKLIIVTDPYLCLFHQQRNLMELLETVSKSLTQEDEVAVHVVTVKDECNCDRQTKNFQGMADACAGIGIQFTWAYDTSGTKNDRDITTDLGWKIVLSRGLDVFQSFDANDVFSFANRVQQHRQCKECTVTFVRLSS